jgi:hypothetical protein
MKRKLLVSMAGIAIAVAAALGPSPAAEGQDARLEGTVVDLHCYVTRGAEGAEHAGCANACISRGVPAGFLAKDGTLYVLLEEKSISVKERVAGMAGLPVRLEGTAVERGGLKALRIKTLEKI